MLATAVATSEALTMACLLLPWVARAQVFEEASPWGSLDMQADLILMPALLTAVVFVTAVAGAFAVAMSRHGVDGAGSKPGAASTLLVEKKREPRAFAGAGADLDPEPCKAMLAAGDDFLRAQCDLALDLLGQMERAPSESGSSSSLQDRLDYDFAVEEIEAHMASRAPEYEAAVDSLYDSLELPEFPGEPVV